MSQPPIYKLPWHEVTDPNVAFTAAASSWGVPADIFDKVWAKTTGKEIIIANLDSGVRSSHPLLQQPGKIIAKRSFVGGDIEDDNGHGTMTSTNHSGHHDNGDYIGFAPDSKIIVVKVFTAAGSGPALDKEIRFAVDEGAHIVNYSGGGNSPWAPSRDAIAYAWEKRCMVLASSGNAGPNSWNYPAGFSNCTSVGATKQSGGLASFSTTNQQVDVAAPGEQVTVGNRSGGYSKANGTSFSCPAMSGIAALVLQLRFQAGLPAFQNIDEWLMFLRANSGPDLDPNTNNTYGAIDAKKIMEAMAFDQLKFF